VWQERLQSKTCGCISDRRNDDSSNVVEECLRFQTAYRSNGRKGTRLPLLSSFYPFLIMIDKVLTFAAGFYAIQKSINMAFLRLVFKGESQREPLIL
jgi:hypothetical protein